MRRFIAAAATLLVSWVHRTLRHLGVLVLLAVAAAACGHDGEGGEAVPTETTRSPGTETASPAEEFAAGTRTATFIDKTRGTAAVPARSQPARTERAIDVVLHYPAEDSSDETDAGDGQPADGRFPVIVFSHGLEGDGDQLSGRAEQWARAGYIVALPTFPLTSGTGAIAGDFVNQPADVSFVIDSVLALDADPSDPLHAHVDTDHIAGAGHSLGGATTLGVAFNSCCIDERIDAAISIAGFEVPFPGGNVENPPATPLLLIHGEQDDLIANDETSDILFAKARPPVYYLRFPTGDHDNMLYQYDMGELVDITVVAFLDAYLLSNAERLETLAGEVEDSGLATFDART
jgi:dienelactone hydrolase